MKAHHFWPKRFHHLAGCVIERRTVGHRGWRIKVGAQFMVVRLQQGLPSLIPRVIDIGRLMAEEVDVQRRMIGLANEGQGLAQLLQAQRRRRHGAQGTGLLSGDDHGGGRRASHRRLDDRHLNAQQVKNAGVWPGAHGLLLQR